MSFQKLMWKHYKKIKKKKNQNLSFYIFIYVIIGIYNEIMIKSRIVCSYRFSLKERCL